MQQQRASQELALSKNGSVELSIFQGGLAGMDQIEIVNKKLAVVFPDMKKEFFNILSEYIVKAQFTATRLDYALTQVITNFRYKQLTIADILSIDVKCKIYSYYEMCNYVTKNGGSTSQFSPIWIGESDKPNWVLSVDKALYKLPERI